MIFIKNKDLAILSNTNIEENSLLILKKLVDLKIKRATRQLFKSHEFKQKKCELSQLMTIKNKKK